MKIYKLVHLDDVNIEHILKATEPEAAAFEALEELGYGIVTEELCPCCHQEEIQFPECPDYQPEWAGGYAGRADDEDLCGEDILSWKWVNDHDTKTSVEETD